MPGTIAPWKKSQMLHSFLLMALSFLLIVEGQYKAKCYKKPFWKLAEWAENQRFGGYGAHLQIPKRLEEEEPELEFFGYVDPLTFAPLPASTEPNENSIETVCKDYRFDIGQKWPQCAHIIGNIQDQSLCSSCYALSTAAAFSDRHCIGLAKQGIRIGSSVEEATFSAADAMDCARAGSDNACAGGYSSKVWRWFTEVGVVKNSCKPYPIGSYKNVGLSSGGAIKCGEFKHPAKCQRKCTNASYARDYAEDKTIALNYNVFGTLEGPIKAWNYYKGPGQQRWFSWEQTMKEELAQNGSITVDFVIYDDFFNYPTNLGIYKHSYGTPQYAHVVRLHGYGKVECSDGRRGAKYWLAANTWGREWGENGGHFRIARGTDECGIESRQIGFGQPKL